MEWIADLGGFSSEQGRGIAVDAGGNAYVTGMTSSMDFPTTVGAIQTMPGDGQDAFVSKVPITIQVHIPFVEK